MPRKPLGEHAMTAAERQRRRRERLREQQPIRDDAPCHEIPRDLKREMDALRRERDAALARIGALETELGRAQERPGGHGITPALYRLVRAALHPDRVTDPATKKYLQEAFIKFTDAIEKGGGANLPTMEEMMQRGAAAYAQRRERAQRAAATRAANKAAKAAS